MPLFSEVLNLHCTGWAVSGPLFSEVLALHCLNRAVMYRFWPSIGTPLRVAYLGQGQSRAMDMAPEGRARLALGKPRGGSATCT